MEQGEREGTRPRSAPHHDTGGDEPTGLSTDVVATAVADPPGPDSEDMQRRADAALLVIVSAHQWQGPVFLLLERRLLDGGAAELDRLLRTGLIFDRCARQGRPVTATPAVRTALRADPHLRADLVNEVLAEAWPLFLRDALQGGGWSVDGGATLQRYFDGRIVLTFAKVFRARHAHESWWRALALLPQMPPDLASSAESGLSVEQARAFVDEYLEDETATTREIVALAMCAYLHRDIADRLNLSEAAVTQRLYRLRKRLGRDTACGNGPTKRRTSP